MLEVARWSGSAGNRQPWEFVVVRDRDMLRRLSAIDGANAGHLATAAAGIAIVIRPGVPDLDAYDEGRLSGRAPAADAKSARAEAARTVSALGSLLMMNPRADNDAIWPALPYADWHDTLDTLHMWTQIV